MGRHHFPFFTRLSAIIFLLALGYSRRVQADDNSSDSTVESPTISSGGVPTEVTVKGHEESSRITSVKPPLHIEVDPFQSIRSTIKPKQSLLLAISPNMSSWRHTHPEFLMVQRVIKPWSSAFSAGSGIVFHVRNELDKAIGHSIAPKKAREYAWKLSIVNDQGRVFQKYGGPDNPPKETVWSGESQTGSYVKAGESYSPVYTFIDPNGSPHTIVGKPIIFKGTIHQEADGRHLELNSTILFGPRRAERVIQTPEGTNLLQSAADFIKRFFPNYPLRIQAFASTDSLARSQAEAVKAALLRELMIPAQDLSTDAAEAPFSHQRVVIVISNP